MGWIYSLASEDCHLQLSHGSAPSRIVSKTDTAKLFLCRGCNQVSLMKRPSGMTCGLCEEVKFTSPSTWYLEDSRARTSQLQELEQAWQESEADFSSRLSDSSRKLGLLLYSSKTCQRFALADFVKLSEHLPSFGMTVAGLLCLPLRLEPRTSGEDGSYLPTVTATAYGTNQGGAAGRTGKVRMSLSMMAKRNLWPTVTRRDAESVKKLTRGKGASKGGTPLPLAIGGSLNPTWVEWLMGFPLEWTVCADWAMPVSRSKRKSRSKDLRGSHEA